MAEEAITIPSRQVRRPPQAPVERAREQFDRLAGDKGDDDLKDLDAEQDQPAGEAERIDPRAELFLVAGVGEAPEEGHTEQGEDPDDQDEAHGGRDQLSVLLFFFWGKVFHRHISFSGKFLFLSNEIPRPSASNGWEIRFQHQYNMFARKSCFRIVNFAGSVENGSGNRFCFFLRNIVS